MVVSVNNGTKKTFLGNGFILKFDTRDYFTQNNSIW
jgi:hypothetical protein